MQIIFLWLSYIRTVAVNLKFTKMDVNLDFCC